MERRLAAVLAADVVAYSRLMGLDEAGTVTALKTCRRDLIDQEITSRGGRIISTKGDSVLAQFASIVATVECAMAIQKALAERNRNVPTKQRLELRIGINLDEVIEEDDDIFGDGVNIAARLEAFAAPGTICVSGAVYDHVKNRLASTFDDLGTQQFKNIAEPVHVFRLDPGGMAATGSAARPRGPAVLPLPERPSIAVLPFANLSGDPAQDYLAEGLRLGIQATLVHAAGLFLIAPAGVARYRGGTTAAEQVGHELGVRYVLEGAVRRSGRCLRVSVELTDATARQVVWAERFEGPLKDGFDVEDEIVAEVLRALDVKLATGLRHRSLQSLEAVDLFYRGLSHFYAGTRDDNAAAREAFAALAALQPDSPTGPGYLCFTYWNDAFRGWTDAKEQALAEAEHWARKAVALWGNNGLAHIVLASMHLLNRRHDEALAECSHAVALRPNCPTANCYLGVILDYCGRPDEAIARIQEALRIAPMHPPWYITALAAAYRDSGALEQAITAAEGGLSRSPGDRDLRLVLCTAYSLAGGIERARSLAWEIISAEPSFSIRTYVADQPYRDATTLDRLSEALRQTGLPE